MKLKGKKNNRRNERGVALAMAVIIIAILSVIALTALAFSSTEVRTAGSDLQRTQAFYAATSAMEKMTNDFSNLFQTKLQPTAADLVAIESSPPDALKNEGYAFQQSLQEDLVTLSSLRAIQGLPNNVYPRVNISEGPFAGLYASVIPYQMSSTATNNYNGAQVKLEREFNNYLVPLFQFGVFSNEDVEIHPGPLMTFDGRIHSNGNIYALRNTIFLNRLTMAGELVRDATRGGLTNNQSGWDNVSISVNGTIVPMTKGSVQAGSGAVGGPNFVGSTRGNRGYFPGSPNGVANPNWETVSTQSPTGGANQFGGQIFTRTTGATKLKMPLELKGNSPAEIIKRSLPSDDDVLSQSRYHTKSVVRILIDDENAGSGASNIAGIPARKGVLLSNFTPLAVAGGNVLRRIDNSGAYLSADPLLLQRKDPCGNNGLGNGQGNCNGKGNGKGSNDTVTAKTVRGIKSSAETTGGNYIPSGAGIKGRILIEIVKPDGTSVDVTSQILSMGMTEGEPNGIVYLQRPLWAAYAQGSRDRSGNSFDLTSLTNNTQAIADGEIGDPTAFFNPKRGFISTSPSALEDDDAGAPVRELTPSGAYNQIVPINVYNVREGWFQSQMSEYSIYERGITSVAEINMRNLTRWLDGVYDNNLLAGTNAVSANIMGENGYVVYISDRRGDKIKTEYLSDGTAYFSTNGMVDNEDIYGPNGTLDDGEDVIDFGWGPGGKSKKGTLQKDTSELPDTGTVWTAPAVPPPPAAVSPSVRLPRANTIMSWATLSTSNTSYFRRGVRLFNGDALSTSGGAGKLSPTKGVTIASENMVYIWGNYNTTGITGLPASGSTLNTGGYKGAQVPASIVSDAFFPLSKTWFDGLSALYPEGSSNARALTGEPYRMADENLTDITQSTSVRAAIIAGANISSLNATPGRDATGDRRAGGIINFPRFLEDWNLNGATQTWNYSGSYVPLYRSTQALSQWENSTSVIYMPPRRNWSFDQTYLNSGQLPPGTPFFEYVQATGFRQKLHD